jgi:hypothetical protein
MCASQRTQSLPIGDFSIPLGIQGWWFDPKLEALVVPPIRLAASAIAPLTSPTSPPRIDEGVPSSKTANQAVAGWTRRPTTSPTTPPTKPAETAPLATHREINGAARKGSWIIDAMVIRRLLG